MFNIISTIYKITKINKKLKNNIIPYGCNRRNIKEITGKKTSKKNIKIIIILNSEISNIFECRNSL